ncbi:MAG: serine/threonine protein kinase [Phycisphaera sp. RhM]|nr:serine/threonine protein kinase [Phycisphaera sp. RhM]
MASRTSEGLQEGESGGVSNEDQTQYQTEGGRSTSKKLSMQATTPPADVPGYRLERFLGSGAFGQVWVGRDLNTGRPVAIKFFLHRGGVNWSLLSHEVKNLVQLSSDRHIVQVLEVGWDSDPPYYVMELVTGGSLEDELTARGALPVAESVQMFRKICVGLNHSHSKGVLHCDLKPANVLLGEDHEPRLADFGQSRMTHDQSPSLGTLFYMAPEQADLESSPSSAWDVYAVGAIMYRMLTGGPPYREDSIIEQLDTAGSLPKRLQRYRESIQKASPPVRHIQRAGVDRELSRIVSCCLAANPDDRFTNVQEILDRLDRRDELRAKRPLMVLGILGPILLLVVTSIYAIRTINRASEETKLALRKEAFSSNELAAKFAARTLESELERYFRLCRDEINEPDFRATLAAALDDPVVSRNLKIIADQGTSALALKMVETRDSLLDLPARIALDKYLDKRLEQYTDEAEDSRVPRLATMFVTDRSGTIFAIAYDNPVAREQNSAGRNYAYRTYFHALKNDLPRDTPIDSIKPLDHMHLSAAFQSTATGLWKVAISGPVYLSGDRSGEPDAVFVATVNLGDFELLQGDEGANQVAVLVEAREGKVRGTILQHPFLEARHRAGMRNAGDPFKVDAEKMDDLLRGGDVDYQDPVAVAEDAQAYGGHWIAAMQPVAVPGEGKFGSGGDNQADLLVLVQYRLSKVFAPVAAMEQTLHWEGAAAMLSILVVSGTLWIFVRRVGDDRVHRRHRRDHDEPEASATERESSQRDTSKRAADVDVTETQQMTP